jgi:hypothetical protein
MANYEAKNGGPAFPFEANDHVFTGMSLRDYFAAAALTGMGNWCPSFPSEILSVEARSRNCANYAYMVADAMLKAREASHG